MRQGVKSFPHILSHFYGSPWAIRAEKLAELHRVLWSRIEGEPGELVQAEQSLAKTAKPKPAGKLLPLKADFSFASSLSGPLLFDDGDPKKQYDPSTGNSKGYSLVGSVAIIKVEGVISSRASVFDDWSGGTSHEAIGRATDSALADAKVESIIYDIDSPGGIVYGQVEGAGKIFAAKKQKPTTAIANHMAASSAYWYLSQAQTAAVTPSGQVGCIGVISRAMDQTEMLKMLGIKDVLVSNESSPYKTEGWPQIPFTEEQRKDMVDVCNKYAAMFVEAIARGRGVRASTVEKSFGQGRMLLAEDALAARMVDKIATLEELVNQANGTKSKATRRNVAAQMVSLGLPIEGKRKL